MKTTSRIRWTCLLALVASPALASAQPAASRDDGQGKAPARVAGLRLKTPRKSKAKPQPAKKPGTAKKPTTGTKSTVAKKPPPKKTPSRASRLADKVCKSHTAILQKWMTRPAQLRGPKRKEQPTQKGYEAYEGTQLAMGFNECLYFVEHGSPRYFCRSFLPKEQAVILFKNLLAMISICPGISEHLKLVYRKGDTAIFNSKDGSKRHSMWLDHNSLTKRPMTSLEFKSHRPSAPAKSASPGR